MNTAKGVKGSWNQPRKVQEGKSRVAPNAFLKASGKTSLEQKEHSRKTSSISHSHERTK